jgi:hypothetical protein
MFGPSMLQDSWYRWTWGGSSFSTVSPPFCLNGRSRTALLYSWYRWRQHFRPLKCVNWKLGESLSRRCVREGRREREGGRLSCFRSVVHTLGFPTKVSGQKRGYYTVRYLHCSWMSRRDLLRADLLSSVRHMMFSVILQLTISVTAPEPWLHTWTQLHTC